MASVRRPARRSTSVSVRTAVVFPVPPFWESTAIFCAMGADTTLPGAAGGVRSADGRDAARARRRRDLGLGSDAHEAEPVAPDDDLVAVLQQPAVDARAVDEHAVQAAVVEQPDPVGVAHDQGVPPRDRRIVEPQVRGEAAADTCPLARERHGLQLLALFVDEILARLVDLRPRVRDALIEVRRGRLDQGGFGWLAFGAGDALRAEQRRP